MTKEENHLPDHFFQDVCICSCAECTAHEGELTKCVCPGCDSLKCGARTGVK